MNKIVEMTDEKRESVWLDSVAALRCIVEELRKSGYKDVQIYEAIQPILTNALRAVMMGE